MYARLLALVCLLYVSIPTCRGQYLGDGDVAVYLKNAGEHSAPAYTEMKTELDSLMHSVGVDLKWYDPHKNFAGNTGELVVLELRGSCEAPHRAPGGPPLENLTSLGSSAVVDGHILPFSWVDCSALTRFIGQAVADLPDPQRDFEYGRAMARLAAHELYHVLSKRSEHAQTGIAKAQFTSFDLLADRLEFEETVVAKARRAANVQTIAPGVSIDMGAEK